ncbi:Transcription initiation factor IIA subunit 1, partial [Eumeta japonica]
AQAAKAKAAAAAAAASQQHTVMVQHKQATNGPNTAAVGTSSNATNTIINGTIKQEPSLQHIQTAHSQPPPLHPTSSNSALILQQQNNKLAVQISNLSRQQQQPTSIICHTDCSRFRSKSHYARKRSMNSESRVLTIHVPASALQENQLTQILTAHLISSIMSLPTTLASSVLQQHVNAALVNANMQKNFGTSKQMDGALDTSDEDESEESDGNIDDDDNDDLDKDDESDIENEGGAEEEPLNSEDDVTDEDASDLFDTDNVIVCQYDKVRKNLKSF